MQKKQKKETIEIGNDDDCQEPLKGFNSNVKKDTEHKSLFFWNFS